MYVVVYDVWAPYDCAMYKLCYDQQYATGAKLMFV